MTAMHQYLAQAGFNDLFSNLRKAGPSRSGLGMLLSAIGFVILAILLWAVFIRKPRDDRSRRYTSGRSSALEKETISGNGSRPSTSLPDSSKSSRRKRRRRERRPRNPTLAQTGGLPPVRQEGPHGDPP
jgi:hypothetical protein